MNPSPQRCPRSNLAGPRLSSVIQAESFRAEDLILSSKATECSKQSSSRSHSCPCKLFNRSTSFVHNRHMYTATRHVAISPLHSHCIFSEQDSRVSQGRHSHSFLPLGSLRSITYRGALLICKLAANTQDKEPLLFFALFLFYSRDHVSQDLTPRCQAVRIRARCTRRSAGLSTLTVMIYTRRKATELSCQ